MNGASAQPKSAPSPCHCEPASWRTLLPAVIVVLLGITAYVNTLPMDFVYDDLLQIKELPLIRDLRLIPRLFGGDMWQLLGGSAPYYRPLFYTSFSLDYFFWKENPFGYHATNIILHSAVSLLVYLVAKKCVESQKAALIAGALFAVHPVHAETVTWISARCDSLAALFMLLSYYTFTKALDNTGKTLATLSLAAFFAALLCKEMAITLPLLIALHLWCFTDTTLKQRLVWPFVYGMATVPYFVIRLLVLDIHSWGSHPFLTRLFTTPGIIITYIRLLILPVNLKLFYAMPIQTRLLSTAVLLPAFLLAGGALYLFCRHRHDRQLLFGLLWFFISIIPVSGVIAFMNPALVAERYVYIPSIGFCLAVGVLVARFFHQQQSAVARGGYLAGLAVIALLMVLTVRRNYAWENQHTFMVTMVKDAEGTKFSHYFLGVIYKDDGRVDDAMAEFGKALALDPELIEAHYSMGILLAGKGQLPEAEREFQTTVRFSPRNVQAYNNLGVVLAQQGKMREAAAQFTRALQCDPTDTFARDNLALSLSLIK